MQYFNVFKTYVGGLSEPNTSNECAGLCPFHDDSDPSFSANVVTGLWYCHRCNKGGDAYEFILEVTGADPDEARRHLAELTGKTPLPSREEIETWHQDLFNSPSTIRYLEQRKVWDENLVRRYRIGFDGERITIPILDEHGHLVNVRRLRVGDTNGPKALNWPGAGQVRLWPVDQLLEVPDNWPILLCAGEIDCLSALLQGFYAVTTTGGETSWRPEFNAWFTGKEVVVVYDGDATGRAEGRKRAYDLVGTARVVRIANLPDGEDVNSLWQKGIELRPFIENAVTITEEGPRLLSGPELLAEAEAELAKPWMVEGLFRPGWLAVIGGHGKTGKTTLVTHLMHAINQGQPFLGRATTRAQVIYVSYEMPLEELVRLYQDVCGDDPSNWPLTLVDPPQPLMPDNLTPFVDTSQPGLLVVDSATPAFGLRKDEENSGGEVGHRLGLFQKFARQTGWTVLLIHHLTKAGTGSYLDLVGSREWISRPDLIMCWSLERGKNSERKHGTLQIVGRVPDIEPQAVFLGRKNLRLLGSKSEVAARLLAEDILAVLRQHPGQGVDDIAKAVEATRGQVLEALKTHADWFRRTGTGRRGDPYKFWVREGSDVGS